MQAAPGADRAACHNKGTSRSRCTSLAVWATLPMDAGRSRDPGTDCAMLNGFRIILGALVLLAGGVAEAKEERVRTKVLELNQSSAVQLAVAKNIALQTGMVPPAIARQAIRVEEGAFDPVLDVNFNKSEFNNAISTDPLTPANPSTVQVENYDAAVRGALPWGMTYDLGIELQNRRSSVDNSKDEYSAGVGIGLSQPILRGFGTAVNLAPIRIARLQAVASEWTFRQLVIDVITETLVTYNNLYFSQETLRVALRNQALAQQLLEDNMRRAEIGVMSPLDITTARAEVASREEAVLVSRRAVRDNENLLKQLITGEVEQILALRVAISPPGLGVPSIPDVPGAIRSAFENRPDYQTALLGLDQRNIALVVSRNAELPSLDLTATYGLNGLDRSLESTWRQVTNAEFATWSVGVNFSLPIPNRTRNAERRITELSIEEALLEIKGIEQNIMIEVDNALGRIETARERIEASRVSTVLAAESLQAEETKLRAGASTTFVVLELQRNLAQAQESQLLALLDYNNAVTEFHRICGLTLQVNRVEIESAAPAAKVARPPGSRGSQASDVPVRAPR